MKVLKLVMFDLKRNKIQYLVFLINIIALCLCLKFCLWIFFHINIEKKQFGYSDNCYKIGGMDYLDDQQAFFEQLANENGVYTINITGYDMSNDDENESYDLGFYFPDSCKKFNYKISDKIYKGRLFRQNEIEKGENVAIIDRDVYDALESKKEISIYNIKFKVIGVANLKNYSEKIIIPYNFKDCVCTISDIDILVNNTKEKETLKKIVENTKSKDIYITHPYDAFRQEAIIKYVTLLILLCICGIIVSYNFKNMVLIFKEQNSYYRKVIYRLGVKAWQISLVKSIVFFINCVALIIVFSFLRKV